VLDALRAGDHNQIQNRTFAILFAVFMRRFLDETEHRLAHHVHSFLRALKQRHANLLFDVPDLCAAGRLGVIAIGDGGPK
jgi:hypothetical protein